MKKTFTKFLAALALLVFMASSMRTMAMGDNYSVGTSPLSSVSNGDLVAWGTSNSNLATSCSSNWIYLGSNKSEWIVFTVETTTGGFYLKTPDGNYVYSSAAKKVEFSSTNKTVLTFSTENNTLNYVNGGSSIGNYTYNSSGIRPYSNNNYTAAYLYAVTETPSGTTYTVTYNANDGSATPATYVDDNNGAGYTGNYTVLANTFTYADHTFDHWNTAADDSGDSYDEDDTFTISANTILYAQWNENGGTVTTVTYDFSSTNNFLTEYPGSTHPGTGNSNNLTTFYYTTGDAFTASGTNRYFNSGYFMLGKTNATLQLPTFDFDVEKIEITGRSGASATVTQNIYVGNDAASTQTSGAEGTNTYIIDDNYQASGTIYTLKVTSNANTQITQIKVYEKVASDVATPVFSLATGSYVGSRSTIISCTTQGADIYYTTDGSIPDNGSTQYNGSITVGTTMTLKAIAYVGGEASSVATAKYAILEHAGTLADPYSIADAIAVIDVELEKENVYAKGIISNIVTPYNAQFSNVSFNMVDELEDQATLRAYRCTGTGADEVDEQYEVVVYGKLMKYNSTYEFDEGCELISFEAPSYPIINVTEDYIELAYDATTGSIEYTIENVDNAVVSAASDAEWLTIGTITSSTVALSCSTNNTTTDRTATVTLSYTGATGKTITVTQKHYVNPIATLPFEFDGGYADIENTAGLTQHEIDPSDYSSSPKLKFNNTGDWLVLRFNGIPGTLTFDIKNNSFSGGTFKVQTSEDGSTYTDLQVYTEITGTQSEEFNNLGENVRYIKWIYTEKVNGNVALGNISLTAYVAPQEYNLTVEPFENLEIITFVNDEMKMEEDGTISVTSGAQVMLSIVADEGYVMETLMVNGVNHVNDIDDEFTYTFTMPAEAVTISATAVEAPTDKYIKVTSIDDLTDGQYLIVYVTGSLAFDGSLAALDEVNNTIEVTISNSEIAVTDATIESEFTINTTSGSSTIKSASGYYIGQTSDANGLASSQTDDYANTISFEDGNVNIVSSGAYLRYNSASNQARFRYYKSTSYANQQAIQLYKRVKTFTLDIAQYTSGQNDGWYLIASPVAYTLAGQDMVSGTDYDLYRFNQTATNAEWENYKAHSATDFTTLEVGRGYLYANANDITLSFTGVPSSNGVVELTYEAGHTFTGWNLVGNPLGTAATVEGDYYRMNDTHTGIMTTKGTGSVAVMEGIFVQATEAGQSVTFTAASKGVRANNTESVTLNVMRNDNVIDRAIVRFNNDRKLGKITLFDDDTKIYIPQNDGDYAIVSSNGQGTMPVNFKAKEMGMYTISVETEGIDLSYLHLIDRLTGEDVNLLIDSKYSFIASNSDIENRFILSFNENGINANGNETFAFQNGNEIIVNGEGELQVFDIMGRMVSNAIVNGVEAIALPQGVYIFKMNANVQKIVVR